MPKDNELLVIQKICAVTAFDMKVSVSRDGRKRGLWIFLDDESEIRAKTVNLWLDEAVETFCKIISLTGVIDPKDVDSIRKKFSIELNLRHEIGRLLTSKIHEGALLEWDDLREVYTAIGKELTKARLAQNNKKPKRQETKNPAQFPPSEPYTISEVGSKEAELYWKNRNEIKRKP